MKKKLFYSLLVIFTFVGITNTFAQGSAKEKKSDLTQKIPVDPKVRIGKFENGLTYYIRENRKPEKRAQFQLAVNAGSILENEEQLGLAHFTEHMAFNGTKYFKGGDMINILQKNGISFGSHVNAYTSFDETVYEVTIPTDKTESIELGMKVLDGWAFGLLMDGKEIDKERGVIVEEWRTRLGAAERLRDATWPIMLKDSRYAKRLPIGTLKVLQNFKHETIRNFYKDWYRPDLMAIIIVGDFDAGKMEEKVKQYFSHYPKAVNPVERKYYEVPNNVEPLIAIATDKEATSTSLQLFWKHPNFKEVTVGDYRTKLVYNLFTSMLNNRLNEISQKAESPFMYASTFYGSFLSRSLDVFGGSCAPKENQIDASLQTILREIYRVRQHGFLDTELERQKEELLSMYEKFAKEADKTESSRLSSEYVNNYLTQEPIPGIATELKYAQEFLADIKIDEVNVLATKFISNENIVLTLTAPKRENLSIPTEKVIKDILVGAQTEQTQPYVDNYKPEPLINEPIPGGRIVNTKTNAEFGFTEYTLNNGVRVVMKATNFKNDEILIGAYSPGGISIYGDDQYFTATQAATIIDQSGIGNFNNVQLSKKMKGKYVGISPTIEDLKEGFSGSSTPKDFETALQLIYLYFKAPRKDSEAFDKYISQMKNRLKFVRANPEVAYSEEMVKTMYPNSKRTIVVPSDAQINDLKLDDVYKIYTDRFSDASDFTFFFVGNVESDSTLKMIEKYLGSLPSTGRKENWINRDTPFAKGAINKEVVKGTEDMSILTIITNKTFDWNNAKERSAVNLLSEALQITLTQEIREKMGSAYSPYITLNIEKYPAPEITLMTRIQCEPKRVDEITKAIFKMLKKYQKSGVDKETLEKVKKQLISKRETSMTQNSTWYYMLFGNYWNETPLKSIEKYTEDVNAITNDDLKVVAKKYLGQDEYVRVILKPETAAATK